MACEIVSCTTEDHVRLHGRFEAPEQRVPEAPTCVLIHGLASNFYSSRFLTYLAQRLVSVGTNALVINTRGHDVVNTVSQAGSSTNLGAAYEIVSDCTKDLAAWTLWANRRVGGPVIWLGHSLGAIKALYAAARQAPAQLQKVIAFSATRLNHQSLLDSARGDRFRELYEQSLAWVEGGRGEDLMRIDFPFPTWMSARAYRLKYGPENEYDWLSFIQEIPVPVQLLFGELELERNPAFQGLADLLNSVVQSSATIESSIVQQADHFYAGQFESAWNQILLSTSHP